MKKVSKAFYKCQYCGYEHDNAKDCLRCERDCVIEKYRKMAEVILPYGISKYYNKCSNCEKVLIEYDVEWDGHRNNAGDIIKREPSTAIPIRLGTRIEYRKICDDCIKLPTFLKKLEKIHKLETKLLTILSAQ